MKNLTKQLKSQASCIVYYQHYHEAMKQPGIHIENKVSEQVWCQIVSQVDFQVRNQVLFRCPLICPL